MSISVSELNDFLLKSVEEKYILNNKDHLISEVKPLKKTSDDSEVSGFSITNTDNTQILVCVLSDRE